MSSLKNQNTFREKRLGGEFYVECVESLQDISWIIMIAIFLKWRVDKESLQMLEVGQLEDLSWDGGQTIAVQPKNMQSAGQIGEAAGLQRWDPIVV